MSNNYDVYDMRKQVANAYPGEAWKKKVRAMSKDQILAIYDRLVRKGKIKG